MRKQRITTVLGEITPEELGFCQMHEHIMLRRGVPAALDSALEAGDVNKSAQEASAYRAAGGGALVDAQPIGCGRMPAELAEVSHRSGVSVIASTGFHVRRFYPAGHWLFEMRESKLEELFCREIEDGMYENADRKLDGTVTQHRAGIVKAALEAGMPDRTARKLFFAAASAARCCCVPLMIHTDKGSDPLALLNYLTSVGLDPGQMIFCHTDRTMPNGQIAKTLCKEGAYLEYDTIGRFKYHSDEEEIRRIGDVLDGAEDRLLLSLDTTNRRMHSYGGSIGLDYLIRTFLPIMRGYGISTETVRRLMYENPRRALLLGE